jgi:hypothetical protein
MGSGDHREMLTEAITCRSGVNFRWSRPIALDLQLVLTSLRFSRLGREYSFDSDTLLIPSRIQSDVRQEEANVCRNRGTYPHTCHVLLREDQLPSYTKSRQGCNQAATESASHESPQTRPLRITHLACGTKGELCCSSLGARDSR